MTAQEYLALDRAAEVRSEFLNGEMFPMSGGSLRHARLQGSICVGLSNALRDSECEVFISSFRVAASARMYTYPDVSVVCGKPLLADQNQDVLLNPVAIVEVLSPSTETYDRGLKFQHYRTIESLREYILVDQFQVLIERYTRQSDNTWALLDYRGIESEMKIDSLGISIPLSSIYARVGFPAG